MSEDLNLTALEEELRAMESETFELVDYADEVHLLLPQVSTNSTSTSCSTCNSTSR